VYSRAAPKTFKGVTLTGALLVQLLSAAVEAANKPGGVLTLGSVWGAMVEAELKKAAEAAHAAYGKSAGDLDNLADAAEAEAVHEVGVVCGAESMYCQLLACHHSVDCWCQSAPCGKIDGIMYMVSRAHDRLTRAHMTLLTNT
jgi:hypothetical protein